MTYTEQDFMRMDGDELRRILASGISGEEYKAAMRVFNRKKCVDKYF